MICLPAHLDGIGNRIQYSDGLLVCTIFVIWIPFFLRLLPLWRKEYQWFPVCFWEDSIPGIPFWSRMPLSCFTHFPLLFHWKTYLCHILIRICSLCRSDMIDVEHRSIRFISIIMDPGSNCCSCFTHTAVIPCQLPGNELPGLKRMIQGSFASTYPDTAIPTVTMLLYFSAS